MKKIKLLAIDADDTLWDNEGLFREAEEVWLECMSEYGTREELISTLYNIEVGNLSCYGYGVVAFMANLVEAALAISENRISGDKIARFMAAAKTLLDNPAVPYEGVKQTLGALAGRYKLVLFTKGELLTQLNKVERSDLKKYFDAIEIVTRKTSAEYVDLMEKYGVEPSEFAMVGNSFKSDIAPALEVGGWGFYVPAASVWAHELMEEFDHEKLVRIGKFSDLLDYL